MSAEHSPDGAVTFLPHRLNRQPIVVRGLTVDELWICAGLSAAIGLVVGLLLAWLAGTIAVLPTMIVTGVAAGVFVGGGFLRRQKRGRSETWLHRSLQWRLAVRYPSLGVHVGTRSLVTRSGYWTTRRSRRTSP